MSSQSDGLMMALQDLSTYAGLSRHRRIKLYFLGMVLFNACLYLIIYRGHKDVVTGRQVSTSKPHDLGVISSRDLSKVACDPEVIKDIVRHHGENAKEQEGKLCPKNTKTGEEPSRGFLSRFLEWWHSGSEDNSTNTHRSLSASHDYNLVLNEPEVCRTKGRNETDVFLLVCVFTIHSNFERRKAIRETWGSQKIVRGKQIMTLFMLGKSKNQYHQRLVELESKRHGDIIMEDFVDSYQNLTLKTIMTMKWTSQYCSDVNYVMKTDDDMYINYDALITHLTDPETPKTKHFVGNKFSGNAPIRNPKSKWYVPKKMYSNPRYPSFCSGTGYVMSGDIPARAYNMSLHTRFLYLEDVYMGLCMKKLKIKMTGHSGFHIDNQPYKYCAYKRMITTHGKTTTEMYRIWEDQGSRAGTICVGIHKPLHRH
ncbi:beta-1,3-galactosyltransferase 1 [Strongylocentrotus purpuratus]|uniref:Hexosyltransferase n=1 Tax=Strongylocentrotus purpuratus TaxID=7668 RepID=A0A7M7P753_STRPU|nr:beta-1,3-galactosyltransferase 1 [Strongylocentrotus purpuratus]XP_030846806.1 beta-1,3-galactosyltransferase 1 [Strongylocentrotus purpuratus]|eukprot:XP_011666351.1 PREDICTED: beta-1,3-galactosyltransferase 1-like [Strongylocentrotus purpuratus]